MSSARGMWAQPCAPILPADVAGGPAAPQAAGQMVQAEDLAGFVAAGPGKVGGQQDANVYWMTAANFPQSECDDHSNQRREANVLAFELGQQQFMAQEQMQPGYRAQLQQLVRQQRQSQVRPEVKGPTGDHRAAFALPGQLLQQQQGAPHQGMLLQLQSELQQCAGQQCAGQQMQGSANGRMQQDGQWVNHQDSGQMGNHGRSPEQVLQQPGGQNQQEMLLQQRLQMQSQMQQQCGEQSLQGNSRMQQMQQDVFWPNQQDQSQMLNQGLTQEQLLQFAAVGQNQALLMKQRQLMQSQQQQQQQQQQLQQLCGGQQMQGAGNGRMQPDGQYANQHQESGQMVNLGQPQEQFLQQHGGQNQAAAQFRQPECDDQSRQQREAQGKPMGFVLWVVPAYDMGQQQYGSGEQVPASPQQMQLQLRPEEYASLLQQMQTQMRNQEQNGSLQQMQPPLRQQEHSPLMQQQQQMQQQMQQQQQQQQHQQHQQQRLQQQVQPQVQPMPRAAPRQQQQQLQQLNQLQLLQQPGGQNQAYIQEILLQQRLQMQSQSQPMQDSTQSGNACWQHEQVPSPLPSPHGVQQQPRGFRSPNREMSHLAQPGQGDSRAGAWSWGPGPGALPYYAVRPDDLYFPTPTDLEEVPLKHSSKLRNSKLDGCHGQSKIAVQHRRDMQPSSQYLGASGGGHKEASSPHEMNGSPANGGFLGALSSGALNWHARSISMPTPPPGTDTMKAQLQALQMEDPACVFIARRINKLGFASAESLRNHFSRYGGVKGVYVSHSRVKSVRLTGVGRTAASDPHWRLRAAALGFVVMGSAKAAAQILEDGPEHTVGGVQVRVQTFHRRHCSEGNPATDDGDEYLGEPGETGQVSSYSGNGSTTNSANSNPWPEQLAAYMAGQEQNDDDLLLDYEED